MRYPHVQQHDEKDCGVACMLMIAEYYGAKLKIARIREAIKVDCNGSNFIGLKKGACLIGLDAEALEGDLNELQDAVLNKEIKLPIIARIINDTGFEHFIVVYDIHNGAVVVGDPAKSRITKCSLSEFEKQWQHQLMTFAPNQSFQSVNEQRGSLRKYFRYITLQKKMLLFVFIASIAITFMNMSGALIFQYVIDSTIYSEGSDPHDHDNDHKHDHEEYSFDEKNDSITDNDSLSIVENVLSGLENKVQIVFSNLASICISVIALYLFQCFLNILRGYMLAITARKVDYPLTLDYYNHMVDLPIKFHSTRKTGELMSRFADTAKIRDAISTTTLTVLLDTVMAIACGALLFSINHILFLITLIVIAVYFVAVIVFKNPIKQINHEIMEQDSQVTSYLKESIDGTVTIKSYRYESSAKEKMQKLYGMFLNRNVKAALIYVTQGSLVSTIESIGIVVLLWVGAGLCGKNIISISDLFVFYYLISFFIDPVKNLINLQPELQTAIVAAERLNDILDAETEDNEKPAITSFAGDINLSGVSFRYGYRSLVLDNVSMKIRSGSKVAIVGETGCGKTTLVKLLMAFDQPELGTITIDGKDIFQFSANSIRNRISYIPQDVFLFSDSIYNNLRLGDTSITNENIEEACRQCGIDDFIRSLPMGYHTIIEENGNNLSGGQKQRLAIVRALLRKPDLLIMDEATSNLDTITEKGIKDMIELLCSNTTCIVVAHRLGTIKNCDYIYVMSDGRIAEEGTHDELIKINGFYSKYFSQT